LGTYAPADTSAFIRAYASRVAVQPPPPPVVQPGVVPPPSSGAVYTPSAPWVQMPPDGEPFNPLAWIVLPAVAAVDNPIVTLVVPPGRDGVITRIANVVFGAGWTEGSGTLIWRILRNGEAVRNFEAILASLGNVSNPLSLQGSGIRIYEGDTVVFTIQNTAIVPGGQQVGAMFGGWFYPKAHDQQGWA
jgi:hypothetical protein